MSKLSILARSSLSSGSRNESSRAMNLLSEFSKKSGGSPFGPIITVDFHLKTVTGVSSDRDFTPWSGQISYSHFLKLVVDSRVRVENRPSGYIPFDNFLNETMCLGSFLKIAGWRVTMNSSAYTSPALKISSESVMCGFDSWFNVSCSSSVAVPIQRRFASWMPMF